MRIDTYFKINPLGYFLSENYMDNLNVYKWLDAEELRDTTNKEKQASKDAQKFDKQMRAKMLDLIGEL